MKHTERNKFITWKSAESPDGLRYKGEEEGKGKKGRREEGKK